MNKQNRIIFFAVLGFAVFLALAASAKEAPVHKWRMATSWPGGVLYRQAEAFAAHVAELTEGRIAIQVFTSGTLGNPLKISETVQKGLADAGHSWTAYEWGKDKTMILFPGWAGGPGDSEALLHWYYEGGGEKLLQDFFMEKFGLKVFMASAIPGEILHSKKPVRTLEDLRGLKMRTTGAWMEIASELGASTVTAAGSDVYQMLERGAIDATEWANPSANVSMGFHEIASHVIVPGIHQPANALQVMINPKAWDKLSPHDQKMIELAARLTVFDSWTQTGVADLAAFETFRENGNQIIELDQSVRDEARKKAEEWAARQARENPWFAKVWQSQQDFMKRWATVKDIR